MPLFKRHGSDDQSTGDASRVLSERAILDRIEEEIFRADRYGRPLVILCALPQRVPSEALPPKEMASATDAVIAQLRFSDRVGTLSDGTIVAVLPETSADVARAVAHRIATDLAIRSAGTNFRKWFVGTSTFPDDGGDPPAIVTAAIQRAESQ